MDQSRLHQLLTELHTELSRAKPVDTANRELLEKLAGDIQAIRGAKEVAPERYQSLRGRLAQAATALEVTHPRVATAIERVIDTLAFFNL